MQLDVLQTRLKYEYNVEIGFDSVSFSQVRWFEGDKNIMEKFINLNYSAIANDIDGDPVFLASSEFMMQRTIEAQKKLKFYDIKQIGITKK